MSERAEIRALESRIRAAWRSEEGSAVPGEWKSGVMASVRREAARRHPGAAGPSLERSVCQGLLTAAVAALLAFVLSATSIGTLDPALAIARLLGGDARGLLEIVLVL